MEDLNLVWTGITGLIILAVLLTRAWRMGSWVAGGWLLMLLAAVALAARADEVLGLPDVIFWGVGGVGVLLALIGTIRQ